MIRFTSALLFALTLCTAQAQTTVAWLTNATGLASLPPTSSRQAVSVGNESSGWSQWNWNAASTAATNSTTVAYTGLATGRWIQSPINGVAVGLTTATVPTTGNAVVNKTALDLSISTNRTRSVPTVAAMCALTGLADSDVIITAGRNSAGDGGGATFTWLGSSTTATNLGTVFATTASPATGRMKGIYQGDVQAAWFGAIPDDGLDDTEALQGAIAVVEASAGGVVRLAAGEFHASSLSISYTKLTGAGSIRSSTIAGGTRLTQLSGATNHLILVTGNGTQGGVHSMALTGKYETNAKNKKNITSSSSRTAFVIATNDVPVYTASVAAPYYAYFCWFYSNEGKYVGSGWVQSVNTGTGAITLVSGSDNYATISSGGNLPAGWSVVFSPQENYTLPAYAGGGPTGAIIDPQNAGYCGILVNGQSFAFSDIWVTGFHTGIANRASQQINYQNVWVESNVFANFANLPPYGSDDYGARIFSQGLYRAERGSTAETNTLYNTAGRYTQWGAWAWPRGSTILTDFSIAACVNNFGDLRCYQWWIGDLLLDVPVVMAYWSSSSSPVSDVVGASHVIVKSPGSFYTDRGDTMPPNRGTPAAFNMVDAGVPRKLIIGTLEVIYYGNTNYNFGSVWNIETGVNPPVITSLGALTGTAAWSSGAVKPTVINPQNALLVGDVASGFRASGNGTAYDVAGVDIATITSTGLNVSQAISMQGALTVGSSSTFTNALQVGNSTSGVSLTANGGTGGSLVLRLQRPGVGTNLIGPVSNGFKVINEASGNTIMEAYDNSGIQTQLHIGGATANSTPRISTILGKPTSGTDAAGADMQLNPSAGTGSSTTGSRLSINTADATASGTTQQVYTEKVAVEREGQIQEFSRATNPTINVANGQHFYRSDTATLRLRSAAAWVDILDTRSGGLASATGLPISTGVAGLGSGLGTALGLTPTGSGVIVLATNAVLTTPTLGAAAATSLAVSSGLTAGSISAFGAIGAGGAATLGTTLDVTGASTLTGGATVGNSTLGSALTVNGGASGVLALRLQRPGVGTNQIGPVSNGFKVVNEASGNTIMEVFDVSGTQTQFFIGGSTANATPRFASIYGKPTSGTDAAGSDIRLAPPNGTGNSALGGRVAFFTPDATSSGATQQVHTEKVAVEKQGQLKLFSSASDLTLGPLNGQMFYNSTTNKFRGYVSGAWRNFFTSADILHGVATLVAGTVTVSQASTTANTRIMLTSQGGGTTPGILRVSTRSAGATFTITSSIATDTDVVAWMMIEP